MPSYPIFAGYSFYLPTKGWKAESTLARLSWEWVLNPGPLTWRSAALPTELSQLQLAKTFIELSLENITSHCSSKWHHYILESTYLSVKHGQEWRSLIKLLVPITFSAITNSNNTGFCKQMGYIFWGLEVIWLMHYGFIEIGWVKADSQLEISKLIFSLYKYETVHPRGCLVHMLQNSHL